MHPITKFKEQQKELATSIRSCKNARKESYEGDSPSRPSWAPRWGDLSTLFRIRHIAYCEVRGRSREEIEPTVRDEAYVECYINPQVEKVKEQLLEEIQAFYAEREVPCAA